MIGCLRTSATANCGIRRPCGSWGNFQYFSIPIGFVGPALGLSLIWSIVAGALGILAGTLFMAFHASQGPQLGLPQMIQSRAQFGFRGVLVPLFATLFTYLAFNVADQVLMSQGLDAAFGWSAGVVAVVIAILAAVIAIWVMIGSTACSESRCTARCPW